MLTTRCPHCSALLTQESEWCSLCLTDLRPAPEPAPQPVEPAAETRAEAETVVDPEMAPIAAARPRGRHARRPAAPLDPGPGATTLADALTQIRHDTDPEAQLPEAMVAHPGARALDGVDLSVLSGDGMPPTLNRLTLKAQAPGAKVGIMLGGIGLVGGITLLLLTIAGLFLR